MRRGTATSPASPADVISQITQMVRRRDELVEQQEDLARQIEEIDQVFARVTGAVGIPPAGAVKFRRPKVAAAEAPRSKPGRPGRTPQGYQEIVDARASGESVTEIATRLKIAPKSVSNIIYRAKALGITGRQAGTKPAKDRPANDSEDEAEPASIEEEKEEQTDPFSDLAPVPLDEIPALVVGGPRTAPGVPTWILDRLLPEWWTAYQGVVVEGVHPDVVAYLNDTTAHEVSRKAKAAEVQIERLRAWEAGRAEDGVPLTDEDKLGTSPAAPDPLLAALGIKQQPKTQGDAKRAAMAAMSPHFHRLAPRQVQLAELYVAGKTNAEIAAETGVRLATVDGMLAATRTRLEGCGRYSAPVEIAPLAVVPPNDAQDAVIDSFKGTGVERARAKLRVINGRQRAATIAPRVLSRDERRLGEMLTAPAHIERPITRGDCEADPGRPCPWVSCSHHLYLDVNEDTGAIKLNFPHLEVWEMGESCSLDVADRGGVTLEEVGAIVNLTRERVRQIEVRGLEKMKDDAGDALLDGASPERFASPLGGVIG